MGRKAQMRKIHADQTFRPPFAVLRLTRRFAGLWPGAIET